MTQRHTAKQRQADHYNKTARERPPLSVGDTVRTRWNHKEPWGKGQVTRLLPHRSYEIRGEDGSLRRRTSKHVRFSPESPLIIRDEVDVASPPTWRTWTFYLPTIKERHQLDQTPDTVVLAD